MKPLKFLYQALVMAQHFWVLTASAQIQTAWVSRYGTGRTTATNQPVAMALDSSGNIVISADLMRGFGPVNYLTVKYTPTGTRLWAHEYASGGTTNDQVRGMAVDPQGNVFVTGTSVTVKYSPQGTRLWTAPYGGRDIAVDSNGNAYVTGFSTQDFATVKLDPNGSNVWLRTFNDGGNLAEHSDVINLDEAGNVFVSGVSVCTSFLLGGTIVPVLNLTTLKYDPEGTQIWASHVDRCTLQATGEIIAVLPKGSQYVLFAGNLDSWSSYLRIKLTYEGDYLWAYGHNGTPPGNVTRGVRVDAQDNIYLIGQVSPRLPPAARAYGTMKADATDGSPLWIRRYGDGVAGLHFGNAIDLDPAGNPVVTGGSTGPTSGLDFATIKYDPDGEELWVERYNGAFNGDDQATAIAVDQNSGALYVAGFSQASPTLTELVLIKYAELENIQMLEDGSVRLQFFSSPRQLNHFQATTDFPEWEEIGTAVADADGIVRFDDTNAPAYPYRFYRRMAP